MNVPSSLFGIYLKRPSLAFRHLSKAVHLLATGGPALLRNRLKLISSALRSEDERRRQAEQLARSLIALPENAMRNRTSILRDLLPYAQDLSVLDVVHDDSERLFLVHCHILKKFKLFDEEYYSSTYLRDAANVRAIDHYLQHGLQSGSRPNPFFDPMEYLSAYQDVAAWGMDPVIHYSLFGWREKRSAGSLFDGEFYLADNPDVAKAGMSPLHHFLAWGRAERRAPTRRALSRASDLSRDRGTIVVVSHDAELGGAQQVVRTFADWLLATTKYEVKLVTMRGGAFSGKFKEIADTFDIGLHSQGLSEEELAEKLRGWAGPDVKAVFLNSAASGGFLKYWRDDTPVVAFIHELPKLLNSLKEELALIKERATTVIGGSEAVRHALQHQFSIKKDKLRTVYGFIEAIAPAQLVDFEGKRAAKREIGLDEDTFVVAGCGVLHWRKSPDKFVEVAAKVVAEYGPETQFVWVGGGPDQNECERLVKAKGLEKNVRFTGYEPDIMRFLNAADLFLLPSEEDPFPLVGLYAAMALAPIVCFEKAGGMPEFVARGCGQAVPFRDVEAMAKAVLDYARNGDLQRREGEAGRALVEAEYTIRTTGPQLLHHIREAAGLMPYLSVVVPNYNYENYLPERLQSIANQTFQDFELILLDDRSTDGSIKILEEWTRKRPGTRLVINEKNTGSPFAQWLRGMELAESELIWIAEADDACKPELLSTLLPSFEDRNVFLGYVKSVPIGSGGEVLGDYEASYLNRIADGRWSKPYVASDSEEAEEGLGIANCIPNASSVVFRRFRPEAAFEATVKSMRLCGDWFFYLRAMRGGLVAYSEQSLNLHRRHAETVTKSTEGTQRYFQEFAVVREYVGRNYRIGEQALRVIERFTTEDLDRFGVTGKAERKAALDAAALPGAVKSMPTILVVVSDLSPGGGQMFGIRLANAWAKRGGRAVLLNVRKFPDHPQVVSQIDPHVSLFHAGQMEMTFAELVRRFDIDLVHSSLWWADRYTFDNIDALPGLPWVVTMHGCYETLLDHPQVDLSFGSRIGKMLKRADLWVPTADKNRRVFDVHGLPKREAQIVNGMEFEPAQPLSRETLGLRDGAILLCLATRAIEEKGWFAAVEMVERLNKVGHAVDLMLIGEGPAADAVALQAPDHVHLYGQVANLGDYIAAADIGLLPSFFIGESMPLVLLEMMASGKPVIATDVGEIPSMIGEGAGAVVPLQGGKVDIDGFVEAITMLLDEKYRDEVGHRAKERFDSRYTMDQMIANYGALYRELIGGKRGPDDDAIDAVNGPMLSRQV
jgi:glycosyltransferase involved in cell wall biosynthesis